MTLNLEQKRKKTRREEKNRKTEERDTHFKQEIQKVKERQKPIERSAIDQTKGYHEIPDIIQHKTRSESDKKRKRDKRRKRNRRRNQNLTQRQEKQIHR